MSSVPCAWWTVGLPCTQECDNQYTRKQTGQKYKTFIILEYVSSCGGHKESPVREIYELRNVLDESAQSTRRQYFAVNGSALCVALNNSNECKEDDIVLSVGYHSKL